MSMLSNRSKLSYTKKDEKYSVVISDCAIEIKENPRNTNTLAIFFPENKGIEFDAELFNARVAQAYTGTILALDSDNLVDLTFEKCSILIHVPLRFTSQWISFKNCDFKGAFPYGNRTFQILDATQGNFFIYRESEKISIDGPLDIKIHNVSVKCTNQQSAEMVISATTQATLSSVKGKCEEITMDGISCSLETGGDFEVSRLAFGQVFEMTDLKAGKHSKVSSNIGQESTYNLTIRNIQKLGSLNIKDGFIQAHIESTDLSQTNINFRNKAALDFDHFKSIASVWNPDRINYRGFCSDLLPTDTEQPDIPSAREFLCEMKTYFSKKGDTINAAEFYAAEMKAYACYLQNKKYRWYHHERLQLAISKNFSNFGQNWYWPLYWYFLGAGAVVNIYFWTTVFLIETGQMTNLSDFSSWMFFANILGPLAFDFEHFEETRRGLLVPSGYIFLWMLWKIYAGLLIYQLIVSTRKFIRKF